MLCFVVDLLLALAHPSVLFPIFFRVSFIGNAAILWQYNDCPNAGEVTRRYMGKSFGTIKTQHNTN